MPLAQAAVGHSSVTSGRAQDELPVVRIQVPDIALKKTVRSIRDQFLDETGVSASIRLTPAESGLFAIREDIRTGSNAIDGAIVPMWHIGDLLADDQIAPLGQIYESTESQFPAVTLNDEFPAVRHLRRFGDDLVAIPFDCDCLMLYYRSDLINDAVNQQAFEQFAGRPLGIPSTWEELILIGEYFRTEGMDTLPLHLTAGGQGMFLYLAVAGSHVIGDQNPDAFWFDQVTFDPLVASEGHSRALRLFKRLFELGPTDQLSWTLPDAWQHFLEGHAVFAIASADLLTMAIDLASQMRDRIGVAPLPGSTGYDNPITTGRHATDTPNMVGNVLGPSWGGVVRTSSHQPAAAYHFLALLADELRQQAFGWGVHDGVDPGRLSQMPPEVDPEGSTPLQGYLDAGFSELQAIEFTSAIQQTMSNSLQLPYLRIPGAFDYLAALDLRLSEFLAGSSSSADAALQLVSDDFRAISQTLGVQRQLELYLRSME